MTDTNKKIALIYYRVSTHQQLKKISPEFQKQTCIELGRKEGFEIDEVRDIYWDDESAYAGKKSKRDGFEALTIRWKEDEKVGAVFIYDLSRLFRDVRAYHNYRHELDSKGIELISATESTVRSNSPESILPTGILALVNQYNSALYGRKIRENMKFKGESGVYPGKAHYGYKNVHEEIQGKRRAWIETDSVQAGWVKKAFILYATGDFSLRSLGDKLRSEGFPTRNGRPLQESVLESILKDKIYIGWIQWGAVSNPNGTHEKIVDAHLFQRVQLILAAHNKEANRKRKHTFLLRGTSWCEECGSRIQAGYSTGRSGGRYGLYFCQKTQHGQPVKCEQGSIPIEDLEKKFSELFKRVELTPSAAASLREKVKKSFGEKHRIYENTRKGLLQSIENVKSAKKKAFLKFVGEKVDGETYDAAVADMEGMDKNLNKQLNELEGNMALIMRALEICVELTQNIYRAYKKASYPLRPVFAQAFFKQIKIKNGEITFAELNAPFDYVCNKKLQGDPVFKLAPIGGSGGIRTPVWVAMQTNSTRLRDLYCRSLP